MDHERIRQSDTWALAAPEIRPWLLMLWMTAWEQTPCGSLPHDDELIAARIGMPLQQFQASKPRLMRGWWLADDGRLYHDTLAERVLEMIERRDGERNRKAEYRERKKAERAAAQNGNSPGSSAGSPDLSRGTGAGLPGDSGGSDATGTGTGTGTSNKKDMAAAALHPPAREPAEDLPPPPALEGKPPSEQAMAIAVWLRRQEQARGKPPRGAQSNDPRIVRWVQAGITSPQLVEAYGLAVADRGTTGDPGTVTAGFLDVFVDKVLNPPAAASRLDGKRPVASKMADPLAWVTSASGITEQGAKLGLTQGDAEPFWQFKDRVIERAGLTDEDKARLRADYGVNL
ncbi:hypothetical protein [Achromobacter pulmonis]|uniref:hypothetical protein n=1 Tax=Achromobacter pulmonis TaxID=1389932 RepID=UPI003C747754